jgi:SAM-dependent methyltransferase
MKNSCILDRQTANIDWAQVWQQACRRRKTDRNDRDFWNKRAPSFAKHVRESPYVTDFLEIMAPRPHWSVLDVGCGAGTLALPLAAMVRRVTAIDFSEVMIDILADRCRQDVITNVSLHILGWQDDWDAAGIERHDVVIASRSLVVEDLRAAINKLASKARHRVIISSLVGDGPFDRKIFEAIGRPLDRGPDYICVYNLLYQMGILADVTFVGNKASEKVFPELNKVYSNIEEAVRGYHWMIDDMTIEEEARLRIFLEQHLMKRDGGYCLSYHHPVRWAIISWSKQ